MYPLRLISRRATPSPLEHDRFRLEPLEPQHLGIDHASIIATAEHLDGTMAPPGALGDASNFTLDDDLTELHWHAREFRTRSSFAYIAVDRDVDRSLGCCYVNPSEKTGFDAEVTTWGRWMSDEPGWDAEFFDVVHEWVVAHWPFDAVVFPGRTMPWSAWVELPSKRSE
jgi:hypothetical protein